MKSPITWIAALAVSWLGASASFAQITHFNQGFEYEGWGHGYNDGGIFIITVTIDDSTFAADTVFDNLVGFYEVQDVSEEVEFASLSPLHSGDYVITQVTHMARDSAFPGHDDSTYGNRIMNTGNAPDARSWKSRSPHHILLDDTESRESGREAGTAETPLYLVITDGNGNAPYVGVRMQQGRVATGAHDGAVHTVLYAETVAGQPTQASCSGTNQCGDIEWACDDEAGCACVVLPADGEECVLPGRVDVASEPGSEAAHSEHQGVISRP